TALPARKQRHAATGKHEGVCIVDLAAHAVGSSDRVDGASVRWHAQKSATGSEDYGFVIAPTCTSGGRSVGEHHRLTAGKPHFLELLSGEKPDPLAIGR